MKTIAQLLELSQNKYYTFSEEEQKVLDDFLSTQSKPQRQQPSNGSGSSSNTRATVVKNVVGKETGVLPTADQIATSEELADKPATGYNPTEAA